MAFAYTKSAVEGHAGALKVVAGTYTNASSGTGGTIYTGLGVVIAFVATGQSATVPPIVTATPSGGILQAHDGIVLTTANTDNGTWIAVGQ